MDSTIVVLRICRRSIIQLTCPPRCPQKMTTIRCTPTAILRDSKMEIWGIIRSRCKENMKHEWQVSTKKLVAFYLQILRIFLRSFPKFWQIFSKNCLTLHYSHHWSKVPRWDNSRTMVKTTEHGFWSHDGQNHHLLALRSKRPIRNFRPWRGKNGWNIQEG